MKLRNKKTGGIVSLSIYGIQVNSRTEEQPIYHSIAELTEEWEDYEESKEYWYINDLDGEPMKCDLRNCGKQNFSRWGEHRKQIGNYFKTKEEAERAIEKLKAWKRLKAKDFQFHGHNALGLGEITFSLDFEDMDDEGEIEQLRHDLDLLFGGEE